MTVVQRARMVTFPAASELLVRGGLHRLPGADEGPERLSVTFVLGPPGRSTRAPPLCFRQHPPRTMVPCLLHKPSQIQML
jgi:hypothetical protein